MLLKPIMVERRVAAEAEARKEAEVEVEEVAQSMAPTIRTLRIIKWKKIAMGAGTEHAHATGSVRRFATTQPPPR